MRKTSVDAVKMGIGFQLWRQGIPDAPTGRQRVVERGLAKFALRLACRSSQPLRQLASYAEELIPDFEARRTPSASSACNS